MSYLLSFFLFSALLHRIATAEELEALNAPYVRKYIRVSTIERLGFFFFQRTFSISNICYATHMELTIKVLFLCYAKLIR